MFNLLLIPAIVVAAPNPSISGAVEVSPGTFVLSGTLTPEVIQEMKAAKITHVMNLREDGEAGFDAQGECSSLSETGIIYCRVALGRAPTKDDFDLFRMVRKDLPKDSRVLIHCSNGNRAAAAACAYMVLDLKMEAEEALAVARQAGMVRPETEKALRRYLTQAKA